MALQLEILSTRETRRVSIDQDRFTIGKAPENHLALTDDAAISHLHAILEHFPAGWCISDLGSSNGTWLNGKRIWSQQRIRHGDEIKVGHSRLIVRTSEGAADAQTDVQAEAPTLTGRQRDVLVALCRPLLARDMFTEPASTRAIAEELVVTQAAVKQHLLNLFEKFGVADDDANRRVHLANEALRRGAISINDLHHPGGAS